MTDLLASQRSGVGGSPAASEQSSMLENTQHARIDPVVMFTKLSPPKYQKAMVARTELLGRVRLEETQPATWLRAPSGYGKTVFMTQWRHALIEAGHLVAWLNLDPGDNDLPQFLLGMVASLRRAGCAIGDGVFSAFRPGPTGETTGFLTALINEFAETKQEVYLFVDDLHRVTNPAVESFLITMAEHVPDSVRLIIASNSQPRTSMPATSTSYHAWIGARELSFSLADAQSFFNQRLGFPLTQDDLRSLYDSTSGWIGAMQLATTSIRKSSDPRLFIRRISENTADVLGYLIEDAIKDLNSEQIEFFVKTSFLEHLHPDLCGYVSERIVGGEYLVHFSARLMFLQPVEGNPQWYRFLPLFAACLKSRFELLPEAERKRLYGRAADWLGSRGHYADAVDFALRAGMLDQAVTWVSEGVQQLIREGKVITTLTLIDRIPRERVLQNNHIKYSLAYAKSYSYQYREALKLVDELRQEAIQSGMKPPPELDLIVGRVAGFRDDSETAEKAYLALGDGSSISSPMSVSLYCNIASFFHLGHGRFDEARKAQLMALRWSPEERGQYLSWIGQAAVALSYLEQADVQRAVAIYSEQMSQAEFRFGRRSVPACMAAAGLSEALYETGRVEEALSVLANRMDIIDQTAFPEFLVRSSVCYARSLIKTGEEQVALERINHLINLGELRDSLRIQLAALAERVRIYLNSGESERAQSDIDRMAALFERLSNGQVAHPEAQRQYALAVTRVKLAKGLWEDALALLEPWVKDAEVTQRHLVSVRFKTMQAACLQALGKEWISGLKLDWRLAERHRLHSAIVDEGPYFRKLIQSMADPELRRTFGVSVNYLRTLEQCAAESPMKASTCHTEELTKSELEVVSLVAKGLANKQIARILMIGDGTVKWHLHNIYGKLEASGRRHVADIAKRRGLI